MPTERILPWSAVSTGTVIRSDSGRTWTITGRSADGRSLTLTDAGGADIRTVAPDPAARITVLEPTELEALATLFAAFPTMTILESD